MQRVAISFVNSMPWIKLHHLFIFIRNFQAHPHLVKASDDLIQESEAVHSFMFNLFLLKVLVEASDGGKHDTDFIIGLGVKLLK